ncbi:MAG: hypothetical protein LC102_08925 [Ignavibacteriales bacterium]|nr:MAG: hypothetical protein F9K26_05230 [Ignavibacteriaceae bacterium]MBW7872817.1 hypothetical protein [Ignavibacteria bacterium]MCZ2143536.1 hypothetical protein [Ignavibacteriales bacterium]OQY71836.1 MAG: hypothetical protein B6D45_09575 [Ignavibacteriales bacterium UTCHB3]MBV6444413.1 hypothetical protein [Ignavibacteriaceae bacterium]
MKKKILLLFLFAAFAAFPQKNREKMNETIATLFVLDLTYAELPLDFLPSLEKRQKLKIKSVEKISSQNYSLDEGDEPLEGVEPTAMVFAFEFDNNGRVSKFTYTDKRFDNKITENLINYDKNGFFSGFTRKVTDLSGEVLKTANFKPLFEGNRLSEIVRVDDKAAPIPNSTLYTFEYRPDGSLKNALFRETSANYYFDEEERISKIHRINPINFYYDKSGNLVQQKGWSNLDEDHELWNSDYNYDKEGNLLSSSTTSPYLEEEYNYTLGANGLPVEARYKVVAEDGTEGINFEFRYTYRK